MNTFLRPAMTITLALTVSAGVAFGQEVSKPCTSVTDHGGAADKPTSDSSKSCEITKKMLRDFQPSWHGRLGRAFQYQYQVGEQPGSLLVGSGSTATFIPNPEHYLKQHLLTFQFGELFTTSSDKGRLIKNAYSNLHAKPDQKVSLKPVCGKDDAVSCLAKGTTIWGRVLSGVKLGIGLSERPAVQQQVVVPETFSNHYTVMGQVDFDPSSLFITSSNYLDALKNLTDMNVNISNDCFFSAPTKQKGEGNGDKEANKKSPADCRKLLFQSRITGDGLKPRVKWDAFLQMAIPVFQFKRMTQFDFVKNGGILIPAPFPESGLNNFSFTWDLRRWITPTKTRLDAEDTIHIHKPKPQGSKFCIIVSGPQENYVSVAEGFTITNCSELAQSINENGSYRLGCMIETPDDSAAADGDKKNAKMVINKSLTRVGQKAEPEDDRCNWPK